MPIRYKYRSDNKFTENIFKKKKIWLSKPEDLNDPLDGKISEFTAEYKESLKKLHMRQQLEGFIFVATFFGDEEPLGIRNKEATLRAFKEASSLEEKFKIANDAMKLSGRVGYSDAADLTDSVTSQISAAGIFCLSESCNEMLMWSHYGQEHKGICIGFEKIGRDLLPGEQFRKVSYSEKFPAVDILRGYISKRDYYKDLNGGLRVKASVAFHDHNILRALSTKSPLWEYEKEWRLISKQSGERDLPGQISEIVFGMKCPETIREKYVSLAKKLDCEVSFWEIVHESNSFELKTKKIY